MLFSENKMQVTRLIKTRAELKSDAHKKEASTFLLHKRTITTNRLL